jgi:hypothetical protein
VRTDETERGDRVIVREKENSFVMVRQHDHARVSGDVAAAWKAAFFPGPERRDEVVLAVREHDRGWIGLDETPVWNDRIQAPYTFMDYPLRLKTVFYQKGVDEVEQQSPYAALLCSLHYTSFFRHVSEPAALDYVREETARQQRLRQETGIAGSASENILPLHLDVLQFCDHLSLYLCLNDPGVRKDHERSWYREGFPQTFPFARGARITARWEGTDTVRLSPFPLDRPLQVTLPLKEVHKEEIRRSGIAAAYQAAPWSALPVILVP